MPEWDLPAFSLRPGDFALKRQPRAMEALLTQRRQDAKAQRVRDNPKTNSGKQKGESEN
jgi:hypothetical protein